MAVSEVETRIESKVKYRRPLNSEQLEVLKLLYRFRFGTVSYIARYLAKANIKVVQKKLKILEDQGYIAKRYDNSYKLAGKPAEYYITPKGARLLMKQANATARKADKVTDRGIKNLYKNATVSEDFMAHCLNILKIALHLQELYGERLLTFTRVQMMPFDYLPSWRPDLILSLKPSATSKVEPKRFFLDIWDGTRPFFVSVRKARAYITYEDNGDWPTDSYDFPIILMLCDTKKNETKLRRQIRKALDENYGEMTFATTTTEKLMTSTNPKEKLWRESSDDETAYSLASLFSDM